ncbi:GIY-YIG nuclease family protein [Lysinibacillus sp. FSL R7-0073]|uniref:LuxR family transcriptional regulator n=1 Tax=Lysinibacillus fusiformis TaxID=28031 RepID=A0A1E4R511_9BACI|nr:MULTISPECIES: GIY-YIG nuclease family protein [Lysinibacillus]MED4887682.1 GIY-YIG nuclease family protein [Lysinibacillus fusiformis]ODV55550.1 LuxR family transcriptional regulator [Lysinibacillus fusiformis]
MDHKKELKEMYKDMKIEAGVFTMTNTQTDKVFVGSFNNLKRLNGFQFMLKTNTHTNKELQADYNLFGQDAFEVKIVEYLKKKEEGYFDAKKELEKLEQKWLDTLNPYGERGYNS